MVGLIAGFFQSDQNSCPLRQQQSQCQKECNDSSLSINATSAQVMPCLPNTLRCHLLNESIYFNSTSFGFLRSSSYNLTVLPTMLNSSCLVNIADFSPRSMSQTNYIMPLGRDLSAQQGKSLQLNGNYVVFNISNTNSSSGSSSLNQASSGFNVSILHGINNQANVTVFNTQMLFFL